MSWRFFALSALGLTIVLPSHLTSAARQEPAKSSRSYPAARTPWGDPNLQGHFTNKYEQSTPLERPMEFEGRRVEDVTGAELAEVLAKREQQFIERPAGVGPYQFRDNLEVTKASRAWLVVDPTDGRIPPLTAEARQRMAASDLLDSGQREGHRRAAASATARSTVRRISACSIAASRAGFPVR